MILQEIYTVKIQSDGNRTLSSLLESILADLCTQEEAAEEADVQD